MAWRFWLLVIILVLTFSFQGSAATGVLCQSSRSQFELLVSLRMQNYASTGDSWSKRARQWTDEITNNNEAGRHTASLDGAYSRFRRYCDEDDDFMAGLTLGEWIGIGLRAP